MRDLLNSPFVWAIILSLCFVTLLFSLSSVLSVLVWVVVLITLSLELPQPMLINYQITSPIFINCVLNQLPGKTINHQVMCKLEHFSIINAVFTTSEARVSGGVGKAWMDRLHSPPRNHHQGPFGPRVQQNCT